MFKKILLGIGLFLVVALFLGTGYFLYQKSEEPPVVYETETPFVTDIIRKTVATGSIKPRKEVEIKSQVSGVVEKLYLEAGEKTTAGQLVARIKIIPDVVALNNAEASVNTARINLKNAEKELKRQKALFDENLISEYEFNQAQLSFNLNKESLTSAENNLDLIREGASKKSGTVSNQVRATVAGMVLDVPVKEGSFVIETNTFNDGTTIATIANMQAMIFEGMVDETEVGKLKIGMDLHLKIGALDEETFLARLEYISPKGIVEEGAIKFEIRAAIQIPEKTFLRAGYSANADIVLQQKKSVLAVREGNVIFEEEKTFVEVAVDENQNFERRQIETGISDGINIEVVSGLAEEEKIKKI